ncbi:putative immunity protein [Hymenobacter sp. BT559]|uniref:putative immunity protein n=1 Tax=Hymenobacter sp. BT559 TaxID=2795729 RepID=UPI00351CA7CB
MGSPAKKPFANPPLPVHHALALEAAACAEQVLPFFEQNYPQDARPCYAIATLRAWVAGQASMVACRQAAFGAHAAARTASEPAAVAAARAAGQAAAVAHMYTHAPHTAAYAAKARALAA